MKNIIDYVREEERTFLQKDFSEVDSLVLAQLSYMDFSGLELSQKEHGPVTLAEFLGSDSSSGLFDHVLDKETNRAFVSALQDSPRFSTIALAHYVDSSDTGTEKQFAALTYLLEDGTSYVAFRGTDLTFNGWKEDFNMAFMTSIPSQEEAVRYLEKVHSLFKRPLRVGGHSKGGNLAIYASMRCADTVRTDIMDIYDHDGPGFHDSIYREFQKQPLWKDIKSTVPQASIIGMLLPENLAEYSVVESNQTGIMQHDPFSWKITPEGGFALVDELDDDAVAFNKKLNAWLSTIEDERRERFINSLYGVVEATGAVTFQDLTEDRMAKIGSALVAINDLDEDTKSIIGELVQAWFKTTVSTIKDKIVQALVGAAQAESDALQTGMPTERE